MFVCVFFFDSMRLYYVRTSHISMHVLTPSRIKHFKRQLTSKFLSVKEDDDSKALNMEIICISRKINTETTDIVLEHI